MQSNNIIELSLNLDIYTDGQKQRCNRIFSGYRYGSHTQATCLYLLSNLKKMLHAALLLLFSIYLYHQLVQANSYFCKQEVNLHQFSMKYLLL